MSHFDHEKLIVYREAVSFVSWVDVMLSQVSAKASAKDQLERASTSIVLNIAEGNAKFSINDRRRFLDIAYGSTLECAACLDVLRSKGLMSDEIVNCGKKKLESIVRMLIGLRNSISNRVSEEMADYATD